jgi:Trk K+ transport system NAD-binding subunit
VNTQSEDLETTQDPVEIRTFVVCGDDTLAYRVADEMVNRHKGLVTVILRSVKENYGPRIRNLAGVCVVEADRLDAEAYESAGLGAADSLALLARHDVANIDAALLARELNPQMRIVVRMFNTSLGDGLAELPVCSVLSDAAMAAPAFVAAAIGITNSNVYLRNNTLVVARRSEVDHGDIVCGLAIIEGRAHAELLPSNQSAADLVLARSRYQVPAKETRRGRLTHHYPVRAVLGRVWRRLRLVLAVFVALLVTGTVITQTAHRDMSWWEAAYTCIMAAFGGSSADLSVSTVEQLTQTVLAFASIALIPVLTATVVDAVVKSRLELAEGSLTRRASGHVVVAGLGGIGSHVISSLHELGIDIVAIDRSAEAWGAQVVKDLRIPLIIGDSSRRDVLLAASVPTCRALLAITSDDATNLETALVGRAIRRDVPVVLRLFDGDFAERIQRAFNIGVSRSVSYLAAPSFAAHMLGQVLDTISVGRHVLLLADLTVGAYATVEGQTVGDLRRPREAWILEVTNAHGQRLASAAAGGRRLQRGDVVRVVATRSGLARLIAETTAAPESAGRVPIVIHDSLPFGSVPHPRNRL